SGRTFLLGELHTSQSRGYKLEDKEEEDKSRYYTGRSYKEYGDTLACHCTGTGETTDNVLKCEWVNTGSQPIVIQGEKAYTGLNGEDQSYVFEIEPMTIMPGDTSNTVHYGYCTHRRKPAVADGVPTNDPMTFITESEVENTPWNDRCGPENESMPKTPGELISVMEDIGETVVIKEPQSPLDTQAVELPGEVDVIRKNVDGTTEKVTVVGLQPPPRDPCEDLTLLYPGTEVALPLVINEEMYPRLYGSIVMEAWEQTEETLDTMYQNDEIETVYSFDTVEERLSLTQNTIWKHTDYLRGQSAKITEQDKVIFDQLQQNTGLSKQEIEADFGDEIIRGSTELHNTVVEVGENAGIYSNAQTYQLCYSGEGCGGELIGRVRNMEECVMMGGTSMGELKYSDCMEMKKVMEVNEKMREQDNDVDILDIEKKTDRINELCQNIRNLREELGCEGKIDEEAFLEKITSIFEELGGLIRELEKPWTKDDVKNIRKLRRTINKLIDVFLYEGLEGCDEDNVVAWEFLRDWINSNLGHIIWALERRFMESIEWTRDGLVFDMRDESSGYLEVELFSYAGAAVSLSLYIIEDCRISGAFDEESKSITLEFTPGACELDFDDWSFCGMGPVLPHDIMIEEVQILGPEEAVTIIGERDGVRTKITMSYLFIFKEYIEEDGKWVLSKHWEAASGKSLMDE
ncbi:MAG: hypothetical protein R3275_11915, partial [Saprospiraceae bacterium]|nr:hypothetical protein [Saprospiraceae bacterium]